MQLNTQAQVDQAERVLRLSWVIVFGVILFSVFTVTPLVESSTPEGWEWSAPILPLVVDVAVVISIRVDAIVARLGGSTSGWPIVLRVLTGGASVLLNVGHSALGGDWVGVGVHTAAPVVLIVVAEASLKWRREIAAAIARIEREQAEERANRKREREAEQERSRAEREATRQAAERQREQERDDRQREREQAAEQARADREHAARIAREEREYAAEMEREREKRADERAAAERDEVARQRREEREEAERRRREERERADRERKAKAAADKAVAERRAATERPKSPAPVAAAVSTPRPTVSAPVSTPAHETAQGGVKDDKMSEADALTALADAVREGKSQRQIATLTGWSTGWVAKRVSELNEVAA
ncbi:hypothetical protein [Streptomyces atratus]|uniref:DUF2637 domain-containing protein n=1 Tax=Streptomyces atratus TaxID=1893 RepID=A0A1K2FBC9_STRAR|nr:hypothetical protein [Streptomyces atratus]SFY45089.1 hypothetical protein SAMN02787144_10603 [Streptomyces atratus]